MKTPLVLVPLSHLVATTGRAEYLGDLSGNQFDQDSIANPFGAGNPFSPNSVTKEFGIYGNPFNSPSYKKATHPSSHH